MYQVGSPVAVLPSNNGMDTVSAIGSRSRALSMNSSTRSFATRSFAAAGATKTGKTGMASEAASSTQHVLKRLIKVLFASSSDAVSGARLRAIPSVLAALPEYLLARPRRALQESDPQVHSQLDQLLRQVSAQLGDLMMTATDAVVGTLADRPHTAASTLALELAPLQVNVNSLAPGMVLTPFNQAAVDDPARLHEQLQSIPCCVAQPPGRGLTSGPVTEGAYRFAEDGEKGLDPESRLMLRTIDEIEQLLTQL